MKKLKFGGGVNRRLPKNKAITVPSGTGHLSPTSAPVKTKTKKEKCRWCGNGGKVKYYVIADDMENPKPYHIKCKDKLFEKVMMEMYVKD